MTLPNRCGLAFVAIFSHLVTGELLGERDWIACTICVVGTVISNPSDLGFVEVAHCKGAETLTHVRVSRGCCSPLNSLPQTLHPTPQTMLDAGPSRLDHV